jgi:hypothetical protein
MLSIHYLMLNTIEPGIWKHQDGSKTTVPNY